MYKRRLALMGGATALAAVVGVSMLLTGCTDEPSCKLLYKRLDKCEEDFPLKEDKFIKICKKRKDKASTKEQIKCSKHSDCDKFKKCLKDARKKAMFARLEERIKKAIDEGKYSRALSTCKYRKKDLNDDLKKKCEEIAKKAYGELAKKAKTMRDKGPVKDEYKLCSDLKRAAEAIGEEKVKEAKDLCDQLKLAKRAREAITKAKEAAKKDKVKIPIYCSMSLKKLDEAKGDFAKKLKKEVINACYVELGTALLKQKLPKMGRFCPYYVKKLFKAVDKYKIKDPKLDPLMEKASKVCKKK